MINVIIRIYITLKKKKRKKMSIAQRLLKDWWKWECDRVPRRNYKAC